MNGLKKVTMKKGSQQNVNTPTIIPNVRVALTLRIRSRAVATETRRLMWLKTLFLNDKINQAKIIF